MDNNIKILIVDDFEANLISLEYLLNDYFKDIVVLKANSGEEALKISLEQNIDFIILDIQMPGMDGFEVAKFLKLNKKTKDIPIIFLTAAFKEDEFQKRGFEVGAVDYLTKPINNHQLTNKLRLYIEVFRKNRELERVNYTLTELLIENRKQKEILQSILDTEQNLVLVTDFNKMLILNRAFLEFFEVKNNKEFKEKYKCIIDLFLDDVHSLSIQDIDKTLDEKDKFEKLFDIVNSSNESDRVVYIKNSLNEKNSFFVNISKKDDFYLLVLTDITKMQQQHIKTIQKAFYDDLTGVYNRNKFNQLLLNEIKRSSRGKRPFSCMLFDIDHFKKINDTFGHLVGDEFLKIIAQTVNNRIRTTDFLCRWGGEEFVLILTETSLDNAKVIAEDVRKIVENIHHGSYGNVTISIGLTEYKVGDTIETIIKRCDSALYLAKANGRNQVVVYSEK